MKPADFRIEHDSMGELTVPGDALWGAQTQRAVQNFTISGLRMPGAFISALGLIKAAAAEANLACGLLGEELAGAIGSAAAEVAAGRHDAQFPVDVFQTGSATSSNMNANEVIARLASERLSKAVHPNDHVNLGQSSNDVVPSAIHVSAVLQWRSQLEPALLALRAAIAARESQLTHVVKTGRTHLMDAMPLTLAQELSAWRVQIENARERLRGCEPRLLSLALGSTAVGTGINTDARFAQRCCDALARSGGAPFTSNRNLFEALACQDTAVEFSGALKVLAVSLMKIANDLRWMNSGPQSGLAEISLPALQPGSSIMPGKVNPVIPEAVAMVAAQVIGNDAAITVAGQSGNFQLNVMLPLIAYNLLQSIQLLANASRALAERAVAGFTVNSTHIAAALASNPVLVTALNPVIGYERGAAIVKRSLAEKRPIAEVAGELTNLSAEELAKALDPLALTRGGLTGGGLKGGGQTGGGDR